MVTAVRPAPLTRDPRAGRPSEWYRSQLKDVLVYERPDSYIVKSTDYHLLGTIPVLTANKSFVLGYTDETDGICFDLPAIVFDDFTTDSKYVSFPFKVKSSAIKILRARTSETSLRFIAEWMSQFPVQVGEHRRHYISDYQQRELLLPDPSEQRAIAGALEDADTLIASLETLITKSHDIRQATMQQLLMGSTRLPGFAGRWSRCSLGGLGLFYKGRGIRREDVQDEGVACLRYGEIYTTYDNYTATLRSRVSPEVARSALRIQPGDILFAGSGETKEEIGKCVAYVGSEEAVVGGDTLVLRLSGTHDPVFMGCLLNLGPVAGQKAHLGQGDAVVHISTTALAQVECDIPPIDEQEAIGAVLRDQDEQIDALDKRLLKIRDLKIGMAQQLLTGRTRLAATAGGMA